MPRMTAAVRIVMLAIVALPLTAYAQETPKADPNSVQVVVSGCPKGRALVPLITEGEAVTPATLIGRPIRLNGKKDLLKEIADEKGHLVEVTGLIRKSDMRASGPSTTIGGMRVTAGAASPLSNDPTKRLAYDVIVMDVVAFRRISTECPATGR